MKEVSKRKLLAELLRDSRRSDRDLARAIGISQPTVTRIRQRLELEGLVRNYTIVPDWRRLGFEVMAFTLVKMRPEILSVEIMTKVRKYAEEFPNTIFASTGEGLGMTGIIVSFHKDFREYVQKLSLFRMDWGKYIKDIQSFTMVTGEGEIKELSFSCIAETLLSQQ